MDVTFLTRIIALFIGLLMYSEFSHAWYFQYNMGQNHYRFENDQTGVPSEYLFHPSWTSQFSLHAHLTKSQEISVFYDRAKLTLESDNVPLPINDTSYTYQKYGFDYVKWLTHGCGIVIGAGQETLPIFSIVGTSVDLSRDKPMYGNIGLYWRAKNQISTIEVGYLYKSLLYDQTDRPDARGQSNRVHISINFGRGQEIKRGYEVYYINQNFEGYWGLRFLYENSTIATGFKNVIDERRVEVFVRFKFGKYVSFQ